MCNIQLGKIKLTKQMDKGDRDFLSGLSFLVFYTIATNVESSMSTLRRVKIKHKIMFSFRIFIITTYMLFERKK